MRIRYVVSTMVFWWRENNLSFEQECQFLKSLGFGVELWPTIRGQNECRYERRNWSRLAAATEDMLVSMRSRMDSPSIEQWRDQIECAKMLGANIVTDLKSFGVHEDTNGDGWDYSAEVVKLAKDNEVKLCVETGNLGTIKRVGEEFDTIHYCLDIGHANLDPVYDFKKYVDELGKKVAHLHLTDNYGQADDHEPPGLRGGIPRESWDYLLEQLSKHNNDVVGSLEMCPCMPSVMIRQANEFLFDELGWPNRPEKQPDYTQANYNPV